MGTHPIFESDFDCLTEYATMERAEVRFNNLCVEDKLRLQKLIKELATASQQLNQKNERIEKLEIDLAEKQKEQARIDLERKEALEKAAGVKQMYSVLRSELHDQQSDIQRQIKKATRQIEEIKQKRKNEKSQYKMKENLLRKEIEYHIETARSTENKADKIQRELEIIKMKEKAESKVQTSFVSDHSNSKKLNSSKNAAGSGCRGSCRRSPSPVPDLSVPLSVLAEQKKLETLLKQQGRLLKEAAHYREEMKLKLDLLSDQGSEGRDGSDHEEDDKSIQSTVINSPSKTIQTDSLVSPQFYELPTPRTIDSTSRKSKKTKEHYSVRKHSEKLKVVCPEKENLAKLIDEIDLGISQYGTLQSCALPTPRDQSIIRLVDLIDGLEITRPEEDTVSDISSISSSQAPTQIQFDPLIEDLFFRK